MPSEERRDEIRSAKDIETPTDGDTCDAVQRGEDPGDLGLVDRQVGGDGTVFALRDEDFVRVGGGQFLGCHCSEGGVSLPVFGIGG